MPLEVHTLAEWEAQGVPGLLSVVIPAHNEEGRIEETVRLFSDTLTRERIEYEILVVNDNSSDGTEERLARMQSGAPSARFLRDGVESQLPRVRYINNEPPHGFGFAVRSGLAAFRGDAVAIVMADASDLPEDLVRFYRKLQEGYDCVFGSRFMRDGLVVDYPLPKLILNRLGNFAIRILFWMRYNDVTNAFKLYRRPVIAGLQPLFAQHFNLTVELPLKAIVRGYRYAVVPNSWRNRTEGVSKFRIREMGSRYVFIILYCYLEKLLARRDYSDRSDLRKSQLQVWSR